MRKYRITRIDLIIAVLFSMILAFFKTNLFVEFIIISIIYSIAFLSGVMIAIMLRKLTDIIINK